MIYESMSTISVIGIILTPFIEIASAPANLNSFTNVIKSSAVILLSSVSVNVTTTPSPVTAVVPSNNCDFFNSSSNNSDASSLLSILV